MYYSLKFEKLSVASGLSTSAVMNILQDRVGFLWIGTQDGLNRYDGNHFKIYKNHPPKKKSIPENHIFSLYQLKSGEMLLGTSRSGIVIYDPGCDTFDSPEINYDFSTSFISSFAEDNEGYLWVGTFGNGLFRLDSDLHIVNHFINGYKNSINNNRIKCLSFDKKNQKLNIGTWGSGLNIFDLNAGIFSHYLFAEKLDESLSHDTITSLFLDHKDKLWIGTLKGLNRMESPGIFKRFFTESGIGLSGNCIYSITQDLNNLLWIGTKDKGLNSYNHQTNKFFNYQFNKVDPESIPSNSAESLYVDRTNVLWIGTFGDGIIKVNLMNKKFNTAINITDDDKNEKLNKIRSIAVDDNKRLWAGTFSDGLYCFKKENGDYKEGKKFSDVDNYAVNTMLVDKENQLWLASRKFGFCSLDTITEKLNSMITFNSKFKNDHINSIAINKAEDDLWIGYDNSGIRRINRSTTEEEANIPEDLKKLAVKSLMCDDNTLWIGTKNRGLFKYNLLNNEIVNYKCKTSDISTISDDTINCIIKEENEIWIGTANGGLNRFDLTRNVFLRYNEADGLANNYVTGILIDKEKNLWISTNNGLSKFDPSNLTFINYDETDGLPSREFNEGAFYKDNDDIFYFGSMEGVTYFRPSEIIDNPYIPNITIIDFEIFNERVTGSPDNQFLKKNITYSDEINLTYRESVFSFRFAALIFNNPQKNQYAYKMEGFDKDWTYCGTRRRVTYTNLNPGDYVFSVKGSNNDGVWNEEGTSVKINISPPYWKTWWFKGLGLMGIVAATGYSYNQRLQKLHKESRVQEDFSRKLIDVQENEKKRIASELHDTIAQSVSISKNKAILALKHRENKERLESALEEISEMATSTISDLRTISYNLHPHQLDRLGFTKAITSLVDEVANSTNINFEIVTDDVDDLLSKESEINLFRVIQESINNIMKHSKADEAILRVSKTKEYVLVVVIDNGIGFERNNIVYQDIKQGFGLSGISERVKLMKGEFKLDSEVGKGTTIRYSIPIKKRK